LIVEGLVFLFVARRILLAIPALFGLVLLTFILIHAVPGDPAAILAGDQATPQQIEALRAQYGFDRPILEQFVIYVSQLARGSLGISYMTQRPISVEILERIPATFELTLFSMTLATFIGIPLGVLAAQFHNTWLDHVLRIGTIAGLAVASFWLAIMLQFAFSMYLDLLPVHGRFTAGVTPPAFVTGMTTIDALLAGRWSLFADALRHLILPGFALAVAPLATIMRFTRAAVLNTMRREFVFYERAVGYPRFVLMGKYVLRNSLVTPVTQIGLLLGAILGSAVVIEAIFDWPGLGTYAVLSIATADYQATLAVVLVVGCLYTVINILVDIAHAIIDPRIVEQL
jgi:peptide/nickel transport system permease protein